MTLTLRTSTLKFSKSIIFFIIVLSLVNSITKDPEEIGTRAVKLIVECLKNGKDAIKYKTLIEVIKYITFGFKNIKKITEKNFTKEERAGRISSNSLKILMELEYYCAHSISTLQPNILNTDNEIRSFTESISFVLKNIIPNPSPLEQNCVYEDYLVVLVKAILNLISLKILTKKPIDIISGEEMVSVLKFIFSNTFSRDTRKELMSLFRNLKEYFPAIYAEKEFFCNENNYIRKNAICTDQNLNEVVKFIISLDDLFLFQKLTADEKCKPFEVLIGRINNFRLSYDLKGKIFTNVFKYLDELSNHLLHSDQKNKFFDLTDQLLQELATFFDSLMKILLESEGYFNKEEKKAKAQFLSKNMLEANLDEPENKKLQLLNMNHLFEILLNNEYEKYALPDEHKSIYEIFQVTIKILGVMAKIFNFEFPSQPNIVLVSNPVYRNSESRISNEVEQMAVYSKIHHKANYLSKLFYSYLYIFEQILKSHKHNKEEDNTLDYYFIGAYLNFPAPLCVAVFKRSMPLIYHLILVNVKVCTKDNCTMLLLIDKVLKCVNTNQTVDPLKPLRKELFEVYFNYFMNKLFDIGNNVEEYEQNYPISSISMSVIITIIKQIFRYILCYFSDDMSKHKISTLLINCIILSKNSEFFGNYIYLIRCLFKYIAAYHQNNESQYDFHKDNLNLVYGIMKYMINIKDAFPFLKEMITEIIMILPLKLKYLLDFTHLFFPSLIDSLNMSQEIIQIGLQFLEQWMNAIFHKPEIVKPFLQKNILQLTTLLTSHLYKNVTISLNSLKLLSKFGGKSRNYLEDKGINFKTCPTQVLVIKLKDKTSDKVLDFSVDNIIDICVKIVTKKTSVASIKKCMNVFKSCLLSFFDNEINYDYIMKIKKDIIDNIPPHDSLYNTAGYFRVLAPTEQVKINNIYRKAEHFLLEKILRGLFLCFAMTELDQEGKDFIQFVCDYFVMSIIAKDKNNKNIHVFEIDPITIFDIIYDFLFTTNPTVLRNPNQTCTTVVAKRLIVMLIDTLENIFDKNYKVIKRLEIVDIMYMKFLNSCYSNDWSKKGVGLIFLDILIRRFPKEVTYKYLPMIIRAVFSVTSSFSSIVKIKYNNDCKKVLKELSNLYLKENEDFSKLTVDILKSNMEIESEENKSLENAKNEFIMLYNMIKLSVNEIVSNMNSTSQYEIKICKYLVKQLMSIKQIKYFSKIIFMSDNLSLEDFLTLYKSYPKETTAEEAFASFSQSQSTDVSMKDATKDLIGIDISKYPSLNVKDIKFKLNEKLLEMSTIIGARLSIKENNFSPLISNAMGLVFCFNYAPHNIVEYFFQSQAHFDLFLQMVNSIYEVLLIDIYILLEVVKHIKNAMYLLRFKCIFTEKLYLAKKFGLLLTLDINQNEKVTFNDEIDPKYFPIIEKHIHSNISLENEYNQNDPYIPEIFPFLSEKIKLVKQYIKLLQLIFTNETIAEKIKTNAFKRANTFNELKVKSVKLIVSHVINREEAKVLKACRKFLTHVIEQDNNMKEFLLNDENVRKFFKISIESLKPIPSTQNNQSVSLLKIVDSLIILIKSIGIPKDLFEILKKKIDLFKLPEKSNNSLLTTYSFISIFAYMKEEHLRPIAKELLDLLLLKEKEVCTNKLLTSFTQMKYKNKILRLLFILRENFFIYIITKCKEVSLELAKSKEGTLEQQNQHIIEFYKKVIKENRAYNIRECMTTNLKKMIEELVKDSNISTFPLLKLCLKLLNIVIKKSPAMLKINNFMKTINVFFNKWIDQVDKLQQPNQDLYKILKYIANFNQVYIKVFNTNNHYIFYLFHYFAKIKNQNEKNKIQLFSIIKLFSMKNVAKYKNIMYEFVSNFELIIKYDCFDCISKYLIIPLTIKYYKENCNLIKKAKENANNNNTNNMNNTTVPNITNHNTKQSEETELDKTFYLHLLKILTTKLSVVEIKEEKNNIEKWKLCSLIITIFSEFFELRTESSFASNSDVMSTVFTNIRKIVKFQEVENKQNISKIYWLLTACSLAKVVENKNSEKYLNLITTFYKNTGEEYINISNLAYEIIFPYSKDGKGYLESLKTLYLEKNSYTQIFQMFSLLLKFPKVFKTNSIPFVAQISSFVYKYTMQFFQFNYYYRKMLVQILGLLIKYINNEKEFNKEECEKQKDTVEKMEFNIVKMLFKMFKASAMQDKAENENVDVVKTVLTYYKELMKHGNYDLIMFDLKTDKAKYTYFLYYIYFIKLFVLFGKKESLYRNPDHYFVIYKLLTENNTLSNNFRIINDLGFVMRMILDDQLLNEFNNKEKIDEERMIEYKYQIFFCIKKILEQNSQNANKKKMKVCDLDFESSIFSQSSLDEIGKEIIKNVKSKGNLALEKLVTIFPFNEFKFFLLFKQFIDSIYKGKQTDKKDKTDTKTTEAYEINMGNKTQFFKEAQDSVYKMINSLQQYYFENFFCYTVLYLEIVKDNEAKIKGNMKEIYDYYASNRNFYSNIKSFDELKKQKKEYLDCTPNDLLPPFQASNEVAFCLFYLIPDTVFPGYLYFLNSKEIVNAYGQRLNELFVKAYSILKDKVHQPILEHLILTILNSPLQSVKAKNKILFDILNLHDYILDKINPALMNIACDYIDKYADDVSNSKFDKNIINLIRILVYASHNSELNIRKKIFKIFRKYHGNKLIDILKWLFTYVEWGGKYSDNNPLWMAFSVDILLNQFKGNTPLETKDNCTSTMHILVDKEENEDKMIIDNETDTIVQSPLDDKGVIKGIVEKYNLFIKSKITKNLMFPIRDIILTEPTLSQKIWYSLFPQIWKILSKEDREMLNVYINQFLLELIKKGKCFNIIKSMTESFSNCYPLIKIPPEVMLSLTHSQNTWTSSFFYIENLFIANVDRERSYHCMVRILDILQEDQHSNGLKQFMSQNEFTIAATANLQCGNYFKAEEILTHAFKHYKEYIEKADINYNDDTMNESSYLNEFSNKVDFCIWQSSLVDCYKNTNKWPQIVSISEETNDLNTKVEGMWHSGNNRWRDLDKMVINKTQYPSQINQIYMMMRSNQNGRENNNQYQQKCMNCIKTIYQDFITFPPNFEKLDYYYFLVFQLIVEAWESTNTLKETEKNIQENKKSDFRENLAMWRDRLPHPCEGFQALKSILDPRNYLFDFLRSITGNHYTNNEDANTIYLNISDKIWNYLMFIKYARKLKLYEVFYENVDIFNDEINSVKNVFPYVNYQKNLEELKFIRQITHNYSKGIELVNKHLDAINRIMGSSEIENIENDIKASYNTHKAYFLYKEGKILQANECFQSAVKSNSTDYHIYYDWAEMCEEVVLTIKGDEENETVWFENTIINFLMTIVYKLDKAKFVIPRMFTLIKQFSNQDMKNKFVNYIDNIAPWVWIFWLPVIFENFKQTFEGNNNAFFFSILKKVANDYGQAVYYPLSIYMSNGSENFKKALEPIMQIILSNDHLCHIIDKIKIMISEIEAKPERSDEEILLSTLTMLDIQSMTHIQEAKKKILSYVFFLKQNPCNDVELKNKMVEELTSVAERRSATIFNIYDKIKHFRYYLHSKLTTENNYQELTRVLNNKLYNVDFMGVEIPGMFSNKIIEPTEENRVYISRFESEYNSNYKFLTFLNKKLLIRGTNDKIYNFSIAKENHHTSSEIKLLQLELLLNNLFSRYKDTYQQKVKFNTNIKYFITKETKIIQDETNMYYMNEVFEFCMQKNGYDPEIAYTLFEEETLASNPPGLISYYLPDIKEKVFNRMCQIVPLNSLKSFIHKFIVSGDEIFIFRKQFATSYGLYSLLGYLLSGWIPLNKISFNKETGSCTFHDLRCKIPEDINKSLEKKKDIQIRLSKNISYFLTPSCLYGVIPSVIHAATSAIVEREDIFRKILFSVVYTQIRDRQNEAYSVEVIEKNVDAFMKKINYVRNSENENVKGEHPLKNIFDIINTSMSDDNLKKMPLFWDPWF